MLKGLSIKKEHVNIISPEGGEFTLNYELS